MSDYNVSIADFKNKNRIVMTDTLYQYDYGQKLQIVNIAALPQTFEAHFSNVQHGGVSITVTGMDGIVDIPNSLLMTGKRIYCWIYVTEPGSGETVYQILLPVQHRPMPEYYDVTDVGVFDSVVQQVGDYAATATAGATSATASATAAAASADSAAASASAAETAKNAAETAQGKAEDAQAVAETAAQTATEKAQQTAQDAAQAAQSKADAESAAQSAEAAQTGAESAKTDAETAAQDAVASATSAGQSASAAAQSATAAAGSATTAQGAEQTATAKAGEASASATAAAASETAAQTAQTAAEAAKDTAAVNATTATTKASEAAQSATSAALSKTDAEAAATRAEQAAATLTVDSALSDSSVNPVQNKVITGELTDVKSAIDALKITDTASGAIASFPDGAAMPVESLTVEMNPIQDLHGYDHPWPAGGGKNKFDASFMEGTGITVTGNTVVGKGFAFHENFVVDGIPNLTFAENTQYTLSLVASTDASASQSGNGLLFRFTYTDSTTSALWLQNTSTSPTLYQRTSDAGKTVSNIVMSYGGTSGDNTWTLTNIQLEPGTSATPYAPYSNICPISGRSEVNVWREATYDTSADPALTIQLGQTVYGGTLDVVSGKLTVDFVIKVYNGTENYSNEFFPTIVCTGGGGDLSPIGDYNRHSEIVCSHAPDVSFASASARNIQWRYTDTVFGVSNAAEFKAYVAQQYANGTPVTVAYPIAQSITLTLDPVTLSTLKGQNNVWSDADSVTVDYVADPKLYISRLTEPDADMVADANITSGSYFMVGNTLYLATANIASGAAITPGVNCNQTNLAAALNAINA